MRRRVQRPRVQPAAGLRPVRRLAFLAIAICLRAAGLIESIAQCPLLCDGAFRNPYDDDALNPFLDFFRWKLFGRRRPFPPHVAGPAPRVRPDLRWIADASAEGALWLGHATLFLRMGGASLLTDPLWGSPSGYDCRLAAQGMPPEAVPPVDAVLISHNHREHLQLPSVRRLSGRPLVCVPLGVDRLLRRNGVGRVVAFDWWQSRSIGRARVTFVPARHWSWSRLLDRNTTLWGGWIIESPSAVVYYSGDTAYGPHFAEIGRRFPGISHAFLSVGAYEPRWFMKAIHMNPTEAALAFRDLGAATLAPVHWGTLQLGDEPPGEAPVKLLHAMERRGIPTESLRVLRIGETLRFGAPEPTAPPESRRPRRARSRSHPEGAYALA